MNRLWVALRSVLYAGLFLTIWGWAALRCRALDRLLLIRIPFWLTLPGVLLFLAGAALALTTIGFFIVEGLGTPAIFDPPKNFVPHGPFRLVRNPMYVGGISLLLGWALDLRSPAMVLFALFALVVVHSFVVLSEEPGLRKRFGQEYIDYCRAVPRWIPRLTRRPLPSSPAE